MNVDTFRPWCFNIENFNAKLICTLPPYLASVTKTDIKYWSQDWSIEMICDDFCTCFKSASDKMKEYPLGDYVSGINKQMPSAMLNTYNRLYDLIDIIVTRAIIEMNYEIVSKFMRRILSIVDDIMYRFIFYVYARCHALLKSTNGRIQSLFLRFAHSKLSEIKINAHFLSFVTICELNSYFVTFENIMKEVQIIN